MEEKDNEEMKLYSVNVHYDVVITVEVEADSEKWALHLAENKAANADLNSGDVVGVQSCVTNVEPIQ